ncbi:50S ribosomal protein L32 [Limisalsivibrio acetivorans]|uniref:50S ribosomal protein L32 n=1 Tax=Limisalsivibrio acetivorans TaxID=1304888 RepID=UPI0003B4779E|nr:50S ribosomal protein L32 [Limisalsivibrio acetivorans]
MAVPKKKTTRSKKGHRRSHHHAKTMAFHKCSNCGELTMPHRVCPSCGYYNKKQVVDKAEI